MQALTADQLAALLGMGSQQASVILLFSCSQLQHLPSCKIWYGANSSVSQCQASSTSSSATRILQTSLPSSRKRSMRPQGALHIKNRDISRHTRQVLQKEHASKELQDFSCCSTLLE